MKKNFRNDTFIKTTYRHIAFVILILINIPSIAYPTDSKKTVTVISWWNYLDRDWVKKDVAKTCGAQLAVQSYKDANEFSKDFELKYYDIAIYESSQFNVVEKEIPSKALISKNKLYHHAVKEIYNTHINRLNTSFFFISNTVFLYDPKKIPVSKHDTFETLQNKLSNHRETPPLIILDDPTIINAIVTKETRKPLTTSIFSDLFSYKNLVISNDYIDYKNIGVFFTWSGEAFYHKELAKEQGIDLKIITIPRYSFITADLITLLSQSHESACVANLFSSESFLRKLQNETYYFSPYVEYKKVENREHKKIYKEFEDILEKNNTSWLLPSKDELNATILAWEKVVLDYGL